MKKIIITLFCTFLLSVSEAANRPLIQFQSEAPFNFMALVGGVMFFAQTVSRALADEEPSLPRFQATDQQSLSQPAIAIERNVGQEASRRVDELETENRNMRVQILSLKDQVLELNRLLEEIRQGSNPRTTDRVPHRIVPSKSDAEFDMVSSPSSEGIVERHQL